MTRPVPNEAAVHLDATWRLRIVKGHDTCLVATLRFLGGKRPFFGGLGLLWETLGVVVCVSRLDGTAKSAAGAKDDKETRCAARVVDKDVSTSMLVKGGTESTSEGFMIDR